MFWGGVVATPIWLDPKFIEVGRRTIAPPGMPVPVSGTVTCPPATFTYMVRVAARAPVAVGVNVTSTVQLPPTATELPQLLTAAKSPPTATSLTIIAIMPVLVMVTVCAALCVCTCCEAKVKEVGATVTVVTVAAAVMSGTCQIPRP